MTTTTLNVRVRRAEDRGHADHGWLQSAHTFSFADYYDPAQMGFRSLRVINDDVIAAGGGFGTHPHRDMEIFSYILEGELEHKDSMGNGRVLRPGQIQLMSAGSGVTHSEFNPSPSARARLLQIWIRPNARGLTPSYTEWHPTPGRSKEPKTLVISPDGRDGSAVIHQDAEVHLLKLEPGGRAEHTLVEGRGAWVQVANGSMRVNGTALATGDAAAVEQAGLLEFTSQQGAEALLFDLK